MIIRGDEVEKVEIFFFQLQQKKAVEKIIKTESEWKKILTLEQYRVTTEKGTEQPFTCTFNEIKNPGIFKCIRCNTDLFIVDSKFDSGTGWPSFFKPVSELNIQYRDDHSEGRFRIEVLCARCEAHLGHVFNDGPPPTNKRYCINSVTLKFSPL